MNSRGTTLVSGGHSLSGTHFDTLYRGEATAVHTLVLHRTCGLRHYSEVSSLRSVNRLAPGVPALCNNGLTN